MEKHYVNNGTGIQRSSVSDRCGEGPERGPARGQRVLTLKSSQQALNLGGRHSAPQGTLVITLGPLG